MQLVESSYIYIFTMERIHVFQMKIVPLNYPLILQKIYSN